MRPGRAADHSPPSSAAVIEEYSYTSTHPLGLTGPVTFFTVSGLVLSVRDRPVCTTVGHLQTVQDQMLC